MANRLFPTAASPVWASEEVSRLNSILMLDYYGDEKLTLQAILSYAPCKLLKISRSFRSQDIQFFVFLSFPLFVPVGHCFRGWLKINLQVHDVINYLNKNSVTHFVWYPEKEKRYDIEILPIDGVSDNEHFYRNIMQKMCSKS